MLIKDVCRECKLTKKAVEYYKRQGLIFPRIENNGYRNYSDEDISVLTGRVFGARSWTVRRSRYAEN